MRILNILQRHSRFGENVDAFVDGELAPADARRFEAHLLGCEECSAAVAAAQDLKTMVAALPESPAPRSFRLTPEMVAAAPPAPVVQRRTPAYVGLVRAGAALSVAAFATVLAAGLVRSGGDSDSAAFRELSTNTALQDTPSGAAPEAPSDKAAEPTPQLAPASNGGVSVSGMATATAASSQPLAPSAIAATPAAGDTASRAAEDGGDDDGAESAIGYSVEDATTEGEGPGTATVALGLFAAAMLLLLGAVEVTRHTRRA